jgi:hypothetical protein
MKMLLADSTVPKLEKIVSPLGVITIHVRASSPTAARSLPAKSCRRELTAATPIEWCPVVGRNKRPHRADDTLALLLE